MTETPAPEPPIWATVDDVHARWIGDAIPASDDQIEDLLADAEDSVQAEFPDITDMVNAGTIPARRLVRVLSGMVIRHLRNPEGIRQTQETKGPFTRAQTYGGDQPGELAMTEQDKRNLLGDRYGLPKVAKAFTIPVGPMPTAPSTLTPGVVVNGPGSTP